MSGEGGFGDATENGTFGPVPTGLPLILDEGEIWAYGLVNLLVVLVGVGITLGVSTLRERRRVRRSAPTPA